VAGKYKKSAHKNYAVGETMKQCHKCLNNLEIEPPVGRREVCPFCGADLHCCLNCVHYSIGVYNDCREPQAERIIVKERSNFCDFFALKDAETGSKVKTSEESVKTKIESLFRTK